MGWLNDGSEALAFARSRTYQELQNGSWVSVDANDIGRTRRQQQLIFSIIRSIARPSSVPELGNIVESFAQLWAVDGVGGCSRHQQLGAGGAAREVHDAVPRTGRTRHPTPPSTAPVVPTTSPI